MSHVPANTRQRLLQVAFDLIWDSSYGSVSVDDICKRAGVNKGSFYHFFPSKAELAMQAYEERWEQVRPDLDRIFSPLTPPVQRIQEWCAMVRDVQREKAERYGRVCGCAYSSIAMELATQDDAIRARSERLVNRVVRYLESAIADGMRDGSLTVRDASATARRAYSVCLGMLLEAKVQNDLSVLDDLTPAILDIIGATRGTAVV